jgi:hypothetical protein
MLFISVYAILALSEHNLHVAYCLKTSGWNIEYYYSKLYIF